MSKFYCIICKTDDIPPVYAMNSRYTTIETENGLKVDGWICNKHFKSTSPEFVPDRIVQDRKKYAKSLLTPYRGGELSKEFVDAYGAKAANATPEEARKARNVWKDMHKGIDVQKTL